MKEIRPVLAAFVHLLLFTEQPEVQLEGYCMALERRNETLKQIAVETGMEFLDMATNFSKNIIYFMDERRFT